MKKGISFIRHGVLFLVLSILCAGSLSADSRKGIDDYQQIIFVAATGDKATVSMYAKKDSTHWEKLLQTQGYIGRNGIGKTKEGDGKTPVGIFGLPDAFGIQDNPGTALAYQKVTDQNYWVDDSGSRYYNRMIEKNKAAAEWKSGEHIVDYPVQYAYAIVIDYNKECINNAGSGIFLHCSADRPTAGCVAIPKENMIALLKQIQPGCVISIDSADKIEKQIQVLGK